VLLVLPVGGLVATLGSGREELPLAGPERTVLLLLTMAVVAAGLLLRRLRPAAVVAGAVVALAVPPWPGAGVATVAAVCAVVLLGALVIEAWGGTAGPRTHPLVRVAMTVPILVLTITAALFQPVTAPALPHAALADWIAGPSAGDARVTVPDAVWGDLVRDGVPAPRLAHSGESSAGNAAWVVGVGGGVRPGVPAAATFGRGAGALVVQASAQAEAQAREAQAAADAQRLADEAQSRAEAEQMILRQAAGDLLVHTVRFTAPPDVVTALDQGAVDSRVMAALSRVAAMHWVGLGSFPPPGDGTGPAVLVTGFDLAPASRPAVASALTGTLQDLPPEIAPSQITPGPDGVVLSWSPTGPGGGVHE
jgi:putative peptide zinc metalloprotease protein